MASKSNRSEAPRSEQSQLATSAASTLSKKGGADGGAASVKSTKKQETYNAEADAKKEGKKVFNTEMSIAACPTEYYDAGQSVRAGPPPSNTKGDDDKKAKEIKEKLDKIQAEVHEEKGRPVTGRRLYVMRHAERMDRIFMGYHKLAFTDMGQYRPYDLNMPVSLPVRASGHLGFYDDTPITEMGHVTAQMIGRGMRLNLIMISHIFSSPALRCVQSAHGLLKTINMPVKINIEPGLFEWMSWYEKPPQWMSQEEMSQNNYAINKDYEPVMTVQDLYERKNESPDEHYERYQTVMKKIMDKYQDANGILILGHGTTLDAVPRQLLGKPTTTLSKTELDRLGLHYPYCSVVAIEELKGGKWRSIHNPIPPITYLDFTNRVNSDFFNRK